MIKLPQRSLLLTLFHYDPGTGVLRWKSTNRIAGHIKSNGYRYIGVNYSEYLAGRLIWKLMTGRNPPREIDHRNTHRADDRWDNLRLATRGQNVANSRARTILKGAYFHKQSGRWTSNIKVGQKLVYLGCYATAQEAHAAYWAAAQQHFGPFARHA